MVVKQKKRSPKRSALKLAGEKAAAPREMPAKAKVTRVQRYTQLFVSQPDFFSADEFFTQVNGYGTPIVCGTGTMTGL